MKKFTKTLVIGCLLVFLIGYIIHKSYNKRENFQTPPPTNATCPGDAPCVYTSKDATGNVKQLPQCSPGPVDIYDERWSFPTNFTPTLQPEWMHYIECERLGTNLVSSYQQNFLGNIYTQIIRGVGTSISSYDPGAAPPWDHELNYYQQNDVCWGNVTVEASESIFTKAFLVQQATNAQYLPVEVDKDEIPNAILMTPQSAWTVQQQEEFYKYQSRQTPTKQFETQCAVAIYDTAMSLGAPILLESALKKGMKSLTKAVGNSSFGKKLIANVADKVAANRAKIIAASMLKNPGRGAVTRALLDKMGPGWAKKAALKVLSRNTSATVQRRLARVGVQFAGSIAVGSVTLAPTAPWAFAVKTIAECVALVAASLIASSYLEKKCGHQGCCKSGDRAWSDMLPLGFIDSIVNNFGPMIPGLGFILTIFGIVEPFGCTHYDWDFYGGMLSSIVTTCVIGKYLNAPEPISQAIRLAAEISCWSLQAGFIATCVAPGGAFSLKQTPIFPNFMYIPHTTLCFRDWFRGQPFGTGNYDCHKKVVPPEPIYKISTQQVNFGADGLAACSILKYAYVNGKNPSFLDMAAQFYYEQSFSHQQPTPVEGLFIYEYIEEFVAIVASSEYSFDCLVNIREITFQPDTGVICCSRRKCNRDRRFYISYASYGQLNPTNLAGTTRAPQYWNGDYDWDFIVTACTHVDATAPELFNYSDTTQYQYDTNTIMNGYNSVASGVYNNNLFAELSGNTYIQVNLLDDMGNSTPITLNRVSFDFSYSGVPWINGIPQPYKCSNITFCRTSMPTYAKCSSFNTLSSFIDDYHATYPNRHIKEIRNMEPQVKVTSSMNQAGGADVPAGDVCEYDLAYVPYDSNTNIQGITLTIHCNVYYKFNLNADPTSPTSNYLTCTFTQPSNLAQRLYGEMQPTVSNYYGSVNEYSNGYLKVSHGPLDILTSNHTPLRGYPYIDPDVKTIDGAKCGPLGFTPPRPLPPETVLGDGQCASNDSNICRNPAILTAFMNDYNGGGISAFTTSNSKCYINSDGVWFRDSNDTKILSIGKVVTPAVPNSTGVSPRYNRCDVEFDLLSNKGVESTIFRTNAHFYVSNVGPAADCRFAYQTASYGPMGSGSFIQYNTPNLTDLVQFTDANGLSVNYNPINYVGGFLGTLVEKYNKFILFITGNGGVAKIGGMTLSNDPLASMLSNTEILLGKTDQMTSNLYSNLTFDYCPTPAEGCNICQDPHILSEMHKAYNIRNYPTQQFNVTKKVMDEIFRVAVSGSGNADGHASCDAVFSSWTIKYNDLFGLPVGRPSRQLEGARFNFIPTNPGNPTCSYGVLMDGINSYTSLQNSNGSIALRVAGSNLPIPWPALTSPICSVIASSPATMNYVATFVNRHARMNIKKFYASFQATPMKCQYLVSDQPNSTTFNRAFQVTFTYKISQTCEPILTNTLADGITGAIVNAERAVYSVITGFFSLFTGGNTTSTNKTVVSKSFQEFILDDIIYNPSISNGVYTRKSDSNYIYDFPGIFIYGPNNMPSQTGIFSNLNYVPNIS